MRSWLVFVASTVLAVPVSAEPRIDIHGLVSGNVGARFLKGVPTLDLPMQNGAVQVRPLGFDHNDTVFAIAVFNGGPDPANIALEDFHATVNDVPVRIWSGRDLARQAKNRAMWAQLGIAFISAAGSAVAASRRSTYHSSFSTPYGTYSYRSSYPSLAAQWRANEIAAQGSFGIALIQQRLDLALQNIDNNVVQRTTVDPGTAYAAIVVVDKLHYGKAPLELQLTVDWNGERYAFGFLLTKADRPAPTEYSGRLAENSRPKALAPVWGSGARSTGSPMKPPVDGAVVLASGVMKSLRRRRPVTVWRHTQIMSQRATSATQLSLMRCRAAETRQNASRTTVGIRTSGSRVFRN